MVLLPQPLHPMGESLMAVEGPLLKAIEVETFAGKVHVEWDPTAAVTPIGQLLYLRLYRERFSDVFRAEQAIFSRNICHAGIKRAGLDLRCISKGMCCDTAA